MENFLIKTIEKFKEWLTLYKNHRPFQYGVIFIYLVLWLLSTGNLSTTIWVTASLPNHTRSSGRRPMALPICHWWISTATAIRIYTSPVWPIIFSTATTGRFLSRRQKSRGWKCRCGAPARPWATPISMATSTYSASASKSSMHSTATTEGIGSAK